MNRLRILPIFVPHAGCRHACVYCNQVSTSRVENMPTADMIRRLVDQAVAVQRLDEVAFYGGSFTALSTGEQQDLLGLIQPYLASGVVGGIRVSTRPDAVDAGVARLLVRYGVTTVELGCQSFSDQVLLASGRGHLAADAVAAITLLRQYGVSLGLQLMPGLPGGDRQEAMASLAAALKLAPDFLRVYPTVVLAETPLAGAWRRGTYRPLDLEAAVELCADMELVCRAHGVPVIRYGLQANENLNGGAMLAGPYHPAFGQLVKSRLWRRSLERLMQMGHDAVSVHPADLSDAVGQRRGNLLYLEALAGRRLAVATSAELQRGAVRFGDQANAMTTLLMTQ